MADDSILPLPDPTGPSAEPPGAQPSADRSSASTWPLPLRQRRKGGRQATMRQRSNPLARRWTLVAAAACLLPLLLQVPPTLALGHRRGRGRSVPLLARDGRAPTWLRLILLIVALLGAVMTLLRLPLRPRYRLRIAGDDAGAEAGGNAFAARCPQPVGFRAVRTVRDLPARPGAAVAHAGADRRDRGAGDTC